MCSLSASPVPTPSTNRPSSMTALVAAACAMIAGWIRVVGQVTAVITGSRQTWLSAPIVDHTNGLSPCASSHGWKWSEIHNASKPASWARRAWSRRSAGPNSSDDRKYPIRISLPYPAQPATCGRIGGMQIGLQIPDFTNPGGPGQLAADLARVARTADEAGFHYLAVMDHFFQIHMIGPPEDPMLEAYTTLGFRAAQPVPPDHDRRRRREEDAAPGGEVRRRVQPLRHPRPGAQAGRAARALRAGGPGLRRDPQDRLLRPGRGVQGRAGGRRTGRPATAGRPRVRRDDRRGAGGLRHRAAGDHRPRGDPGRQLLVRATVRPSVAAVSAAARTATPPPPPG